MSQDTSGASQAASISSLEAQMREQRARLFAIRVEHPTDNTFPGERVFRITYNGQQFNPLSLTPTEARALYDEIGKTFALIPTEPTQKRKAKKSLKERRAEAMTRSSEYLADANEARDQGDLVKANKLYAKGQYWLDRYTLLSEDAEKPVPKR